MTMSLGEKYSFSKLSLFNSCKYAYYLTYVEGQRGDDNAFSQYGTLIHSILERWAKGNIPIVELASVFEWEFDTEVSKQFPYNKYKDLRESYYNQGIEFLTAFDGLPDYTIIAAEEKFETQIDDWIFNGIIDLILQDKSGEFVVWDWKSKAGFKNETEQKAYARQLYGYSLYVKEKYGHYPKKLCFGMFRQKEQIEINFNIKQMLEAIDWMRHTVKDIRSCWDYEPTINLFFCRELCGHSDCQFIEGS